ncbi:unnamed protein product [Sphagnum jensenii]|uniref:Uncharacterized protein n=1 Tax=Sphagnum jensenii TaxID=128206 RepID=A0ABP1A4C6_9BRYO
MAINFKLILGIIGNIISMCLFASPIYLKVALQILVVTINLFGCLIELIYISICLEYAPKKTQTKTLKLLAAVVVFFILAVVIVLEVVHDKHRHEFIIGVLCAVFSVGMYASLLTVMVDPEYYTPSPMPFLPSE